MNFSAFLSTFITIIVGIGVFIMLRSVMLWYWKIDTIIKNQEQQNKLIKQQTDILEQIYILQGGQKTKPITQESEDQVRVGRFIIPQSKTSETK